MSSPAELAAILRPLIEFLGSTYTNVAAEIAASEKVIQELRKAKAFLASKLDPEARPLLSRDAPPSPAPPASSDNGAAQSASAKAESSASAPASTPAARGLSPGGRISITPAKAFTSRLASQTPRAGAAATPVRGTPARAGLAGKGGSTRAARSRAAASPSAPSPGQ